jgi:N-acetylglucosamine-6-phosphate deacetylase
MDTLILHGKVITPANALAQIARTNAGSWRDPSGVIDDGALWARDGVIVSVQESARAAVPAGAQVVDAGGLYVAPGLIDAHTHGGHGFDFMTCTQEQLEELLAWLPSTGVTSLLPTLASSPFEEELEMVRRLAEARQRPPAGAQMIGLHLEGPYFSPEKRGAQPAKALRWPDLEEMRRLVEASQHSVRLVTLAPELPGAIPLIQYLVQQGIVASAGHSNATYEETMAAVEAGLSRVAHLFNGMSAFGHRAPGLAGATLAEDRIYAEIVLDGIHVHPAAARVALRAKGPERLVLVTDSTQAAGLGDGIYIRPGERKVIVKDGAARLETGGLAGSILTMDRAVANAAAFLELPLPQAVRLGSQTAADSLGLRRKGRLEAGCDADLILVDDAMHVKAAFIAGKQVF